MQSPQLSNYPRDPSLGDHFVLKRHLMKLVGARFSIFDPQGKLAYLVEQKGFKLKEEIRVFADESKSRELFTIKARQVIDFSAAYDVTDSSTGQRIGTLKRRGLKSMVRDEWVVMDAVEREIGTVVEDSLLLGLVRRFLTNLIPQNYDLLLNGNKAVDFRQNFNPFSYHLRIDFVVPPQDFDRRLGIACAVLLAAIEGRQGG